MEIHVIPCGRIGQKSCPCGVGIGIPPADSDSRNESVDRAGCAPLHCGSRSRGTSTICVCSEFRMHGP